MNLKKLGYCLSTLILFQCFQKIEAQSARKYVNEFLYLGVGARQYGMGKSAAGSSDDVTAGYWNPALLTKIEDNLQIGLMHNFYFQNIANYDYLGLAAKVNKDNSFGFSMVRFGVDGILNTLDLITNGEIDYNRVKTFSAVDYAFMPSFASRTNWIKSIDKSISFGVTGKMIHRRVGEFAKAWGFGADASIQISPRQGNWGLGIIVRDITSTFTNWSYNFTNSQKDIYYLTGNTIPANSLEIGVPRIESSGFLKQESGNMFFEEDAAVIVTFDGKRNSIVKSNFASIDLRMGAEAGYKIPEKKVKLAARLGFFNYQQQVRQNGKLGISVNPTAGIGVQVDKLSIDYAISSFTNNGLGLYSNIISLKLGITPGK